MCCYFENEQRWAGWGTLIVGRVSAGRRLFRRSSYTWASCQPPRVLRLARSPNPPLSPHLDKLMVSKKSKKPFKFFTPSSLGVPTNIVVGPLEYRAAMDVDAKGERNRPYRELSGGQPDPILDEDNPKPSRIVSRGTESGAQEPPVPGASSAFMPDDIEQGERLTSKCY